MRLRTDVDANSVCVFIAPRRRELSDDLRPALTHRRAHFIRHGANARTVTQHPILNAQDHARSCGWQKGGSLALGARFLVATRRVLCLAAFLAGALATLPRGLGGGTASGGLFPWPVYLAGLALDTLGLPRAIMRPSRVV